MTTRFIEHAGVHDVCLPWMQYLSGIDNDEAEVLDLEVRTALHGVELRHLVALHEAMLALEAGGDITQRVAVDYKAPLQDHQRDELQQAVLGVGVQSVRDALAMLLGYLANDAPSPQQPLKHWLIADLQDDTGSQIEDEVFDRLQERLPASLTLSHACAAYQLSLELAAG